MADCLFCKIAGKEIPSRIAFEDEKMISFEDIHPEAPIHLLFIPKEHIEWTDDFSEREMNIVRDLIFKAKEISQEKGIDNAYKLIFNVGKTGHISHIHLHLLGGWTKDIPLHNV